MDNALKRKKLLKKIGLSSLITASFMVACFLPFLLLNTRRATTCYFHFNIDYRLGREDVEDTIIREPYYKLLKLYEKHPNWKFTVECQAAMIEKIYEDKDYKEIAKLTEKLVEREQMELICALQYSQLFYAYPEDVLEKNLNYAEETLDKHDLLDKRSNCLLFQEGQFGYGLATALKTHTDDIDTVLISTQQLRDFEPPGYLGLDYPVFKLKNSESGKSIHLLQYDYLPKWEAGYYHSWNFLLDAELGFEDADSCEEFIVDDDKLAAYEQELLMLELQGNTFFTCSEWVNHCKEVGAVGQLDYYIPECNWGTTKYNSSYIWSANNGDSTDDGEMLANNYRCRQILLATRKIYETYKSSVSVGNRSIIEEKLEYAEKKWLQATVTDSTGIGPDAIERVTAENNVLTAQENCSQILQILANEIEDLDVDKLQVDLKTGAIYNNTNQFLSLINITDTTLKLKELPFEVDLNSIVLDGDKLNPNVVVSKGTYNSSDADNETLPLFRLDVTFRGSHDWANDSIQSISIKFQYEDEDENFKEIVYCPSLLEQETKRLWRYNYIYDPLYIFLPLSNGMLFIPDDYTGFRGDAIIKNVTARHTSWLWQYYYMEVLETEGLHLDAHHQFYILEDVSLNQAQRFANRINVYPHWTVSQNVSLIQGNGVYDVYKTMENRIAEDEAAGEWW